MQLVARSGRSEQGPDGILSCLVHPSSQPGEGGVASLRDITACDSLHPRAISSSLRHTPNRHPARRLHSTHGCKPRQDGIARLTAPSSLVRTRPTQQKIKIPGRSAPALPQSDSETPHAAQNPRRPLFAIVYTFRL